MDTRTPGVPPRAPEVYPFGDYDCTLLEDGSARIHAWRGRETDLRIPERLGTHPVACIGVDAFRAHEGLRRVSVPDSVTAVEGNPFRNCPALREIAVSPDQPLLAVLDGVLYSKPDRRLVCCPAGPARTSFAVPRGIAVIGAYAFADCAELRRITLPETVTALEEGAFAFSGLTELTFPEGLAGLPRSVCCGCQALTAVTLPKGLTAIGESAFAGCRALPALDLPEGLTLLGDWAFDCCLSLTAVRLPRGLTAIGAGTFHDCAALPEVIFPEGITAIGDEAFAGCTRLIRAELPGALRYIGDRAFSGCRSLEAVTLPEGLEYIGGRAFLWCTRLRSLALPGSLTHIGQAAFHCYDEKTKTLPPLPGLAFSVPRGSPAARYCKENGLNYRYPDALDWLRGD